jgi:hypothetical protein
MSPISSTVYLTYFINYNFDSADVFFRGSGNLPPSVGIVHKKFFTYSSGVVQLKVLTYVCRKVNIYSGKQILSKQCSINGQIEEIERI